MDNGIKENIILNKKPSTNKFSYELICSGMVPSIPEVGGVLFNDKETGKEKGAILVPYMTDSSENGAYSEDLHYSLEEIDKSKDKYKLTLTVSKEYLNDESRVYPVIIDPTYTAAAPNGAKDVYIESGYPTSNFYVSTIRKMPIGYGSTDKVCRTLMKFQELNAKISKNYVTSATLKLYELSNGSPFSTVEVHKNVSTWALGEVTWNKRPQWTSTVYASKKLSNASGAQSLNITKLVQEWARGTQANWGILLKASVESSGTKNYNSFHGTRSSTAAKRPTLTVNYTVPSPKPPGKAEVTVNGAKTVYVNNKNGDKALAVKWTGITSNCLEAVQARHIRYKADNVFDNATETMAYKNTGIVAASGTYNTKAALSSGWTEGRYGIGIRGVDKGNNKGSGTYCYVYVDNTAPNKVSNIKLTSSRDEASKTTSKVKVTYTSGSDPGTNSSGVAKHNIVLYGEDGNVIQNITTTNMSNYTFTNVEAGQNVYVKIASIDKAGNNSGFIQSSNHTISNMVLPEIKEPSGLISNIKDNPWVNNDVKDMLISWDVDYKDVNEELVLNKITANITKSDNISVEGMSEKTLLFPEDVKGFPKEYKNYKINDLFDNFNTLPDGKYKIKVRFYASDGIGFDEGELLYNKDNVSPTLSLLSPQEGKVLKGVVPISYSAADNESGSGNIGIKKVYIIDSLGKERLLSESLDIYNLNTTEYDEGSYKIKVIVYDMAGNKSEVIRNVSISNPPPTPIVSLDKTFGKNNDILKLNYNWVKGDEGISKVDHIEYSLNTKDSDATWINIDNSDPNVDDSTKYDVKTADIILQNAEEGENILYFRAVDSDNIPGEVRSLKYTVDNTVPDVILTSPANNSKFIDLVFLKGTITDDHLDSYEVYIANGENPSDNSYNLIKSINNPKEKTCIDGTLAVINLKDNDNYPVGNKFTIKVRAKDKCGNVNEQGKIIIEKKEVIHHNADFDIEKIKDGDENIVIIDDEKTDFGLKTLEGGSYIPTNPSYFISGNQISKGNDNKFDFSDNEKFADDSIHSILVRDDCGNDMKYSSSTYEYNLYDNISSDNEELINVSKAENGSLSLTEGQTQGSYIIKDNAVSAIPETTLSLKLNAEETVSGNGSIDYYLKLNNGEYIKVDNDKEYYLGGSTDKFISDTLKLDSLELKAVLKADGEDIPIINSVNVTLRGTGADVLKVDMMNKYNPKNVMAVPQLNYKTKISWEKVAEDNDNVSYEIYRSTTPNFDPNTTECVQEGVKEDYWYDNYTPIDQFNNANNNEGITARSIDVSGKRFYYKIKAVKDFSGNIRKSSGSSSVAAILPAMDEYTKRLGIKDYWGYNEFDTSTGEGYIEQSLGNMVYKQSDAYVKGKELDIELERTYNSLSTSKTPMGYSWDFSFNPILLSTYNEYGDEQGMVFKDGSGTIYNFLKINSSKAIEEIKDETSGKVKEIYTHYKSPLGIYVHLKKVEKIDFEDKDKDGDFSEVTDVNYVIETADKMTYTFDRSSQVKKIKDTNSNEVDFTYNERGQIVEVENYNGKTKEEVEQKDNKKRSRITFDYTKGEEQSDLIQTATLPSGQVVKYEYDSNDVLLCASLYENKELQSDPYLTYEYGYSGGQLSKIIDPKGNKYGIDYYTSGEERDRVESIQDPNGDMRKYIYTKDNGQTGDLQTYNETTEEIYVNNDSIVSRIIPSTTKIGESKSRYNVDGNIIYTKDVLGSESESIYIGGLERESKADVTSYDLDDNGVVRQKSEEIKETTQYDDIPDNNTIIGKITESKGNVVKETNSDGNVTDYSYDNGNPNNDTNPTSMTMSYDEDKTMSESYKYDDKGNLTEMTDKDSGDKIISEYDDNGQVIKEVNSVNGKVTDTTYYSYDEAGNLISEETVAGPSAKNASSSSKTESKYDDYGREILEKDARGYVTEHVFDALDREVRTIYYTKKSENLDNVDKSEYVDEVHEYDKNGNLTREKDREGRETLYTYDNMNRVTSRTVTMGEYSKTWNIEYSVENVDVYFPSGTIHYDKAYVETEKNPDGEVTSVIYKDKAGNAVKNISKGNVTSLKYNKHSEIIETYMIGQDDLADNNTHNGMVIIATYDKNGNNTKNIVNPVWDEELNAYKVKDDETIINSYKYDSLGNTIESKDPEGNITTFAYDTNSQVTKINLPTVEGSNAKNVTNHTYDIVDSQGNTVTRTLNSEGQISETAEDPYGNIVRETDHGYNKDDDKKIETTYTYDDNGNKLSETTAGGSVYYEYDDMNNMTKSVSKKNEQGEEVNYSTYTYDNFGEMTSRKDYQGGKLYRIALYKYDALKRLTHYYEGEEPAKDSEGNYIDVNYVVYSYDIEENLTGITYPSDINIKKITYEYGKYDRLESVYSSEDISSKGSLVRKYHYAGDNRVNRIEDYHNENDYVEKTYTYDKFGRYTSINIKDTLNSNSPDLKEYYKYSYDKNSNIVSEEMFNNNTVSGNGEEENSGEDDEGISHKVGLDGVYHIRRDYTYDELDRIKDSKEYTITSETDPETSEETKTDSLYMTTSYTYDTMGNRKSETKNGKTKLYVYDEDGLNFLNAVKDKDNGETLVSYKYDKDGNMIHEEDFEHNSVTSHTYDELGQVIKSVVTKTKEGISETKTTTNTYNGAGERIAKDVDGDKTYYHVVNDAILYTYKITSDESGNDTRKITSQNVIAPDGSVISTKRDSGYYIYNLDLKGSTVSVISPNGSYELIYAYDIYGEPIRRGDKDFYNEITFTGAVYDESTGLFHLSSRYYDPTTGRFISMDSYRGELDDPMSLNLYAYCQGNPISYTDTDGDMPHILVGALIGGGVSFVQEIISQTMVEGKGLSDVNWEKVGAKTFLGASMGALTGGLSAAAPNIAVSTTINAFGGGSEAYIGGLVDQHGKGLKNKQVNTLDIVGGAISSGLGNYTVDVIKGANPSKKSNIVNTAKKMLPAGKAVKKSIKANNKKVKAKVKKIKKKIVKTVKKVKKAIKKTVKKVVRKAKKVYRAVKRTVKRVYRAAKKVVRRVKTVVKRTARRVVQTVKRRAVRFISRFKWW